MTMTLVNKPLSVMLVEDNVLLSQELTAFFLNCGHTVCAVANGFEMDEQLLATMPQVVVLDLNLPGEDGLSIARRLRQLYPCTGIVMLTARNLEHERLAGYENGADIYLTKPANLVELKAVVQSLGARLEAMRESLQQQAWRLDVSLRLLTSPKGRCIVLSKTEVALLQLLQAARVQSQCQALNPAEIIEILSTMQAVALSESTLRVAISRLRSKFLELAPDSPSIESQRGQGYLLSLRMSLN
jgi:DNA-binding response OmpR family regulator